MRLCSKKSKKHFALIRGEQVFMYFVQISDNHTAISLELLCQPVITNSNNVS